MTTKLTQKHPLKGTQEFELIDDHVRVKIKAPFQKEEVSTVVLEVLDPEPVIDKSQLHFKSRVNGCPLISLSLGKPNTEEFNAFVGALKQKAQDEFHAFAGLRSSSHPDGLGDNVFDEPPEFEDAESDLETRIRQDVDVSRIEESIQMLKQHLDEEEIKAFLTALEALKENPESERHLAETVKAFDELGPYQGAVLTYAPYVNSVLSDVPLSY